MSLYFFCQTLTDAHRHVKVVSEVSDYFQMLKIYVEKQELLYCYKTLLGNFYVKSNLPILNLRGEKKGTTVSRYRGLKLDILIVANLKNSKGYALIDIFKYSFTNTIIDFSYSMFLLIFKIVHW